MEIVWFLLANTVLSTDASFLLLDVIEDIRLQFILEFFQKLTVLKPFYGTVQVKISVPNMAMTNHYGLVSDLLLTLLN